MKMCSVRHPRCSITKQAVSQTEFAPHRVLTEKNIQVQGRNMGDILQFFVDSIMPRYQFFKHHMQVLKKVLELFVAYSDVLLVKCWKQIFSVIVF